MKSQTLPKMVAVHPKKKRNRILADYFDMFVKKAAAGVYDGES